MSNVFEIGEKDSIKLLVEGKSKFVALYLEEPGRTAEIFGPDADEVCTDPLLYIRGPGVGWVGVTKCQVSQNSLNIFL